MSGANHLASSSGRELPRFARRWAVLFGLVAVASLASGCRRSEEPNRFAEGAFAAVIRNIGQSMIGAPMAMCEALRGQFRADSGATIGYLPHETFSKDYSAGLAAYAQRDGVAFMIVAAMATSAEHEPQMRACIKALRFE